MSMTAEDIGIWATVGESETLEFKKSTAEKERACRRWTGPSRDQVGTKSGLSAQQVQVLELAESPKPLPQLMESVGRTNRTKFRDQIVRPLLDAGLLEMTIPDKPRSSKQEYRTTAAGLRQIGKEAR